MRTAYLASRVLVLLMASPVGAMADQVMMKDGSSFDVRGFEIIDSVVNMVALNGRTWSVWSELVDLEATRRANGMDSADLRSPGWGRQTERTPEPPEPTPVEPVVSSPMPPEPVPVEPMPPEPVTLVEEETIGEPEAEPVMGQAQQGAEAIGRKRFQLLFNGSYHATTLGFSQSETFDLFLEEGSLESEYRGGRGPAFEVGGGYFVTESFGLGGSFELFDRKNEGAFVEALPHPFFFDRPRSLSGDLTELSYREIAIHISAKYSAAATQSLLIEVWGGPTVFLTETDILAEVLVVEQYPFDDVSFQGTEIQKLKDTPLGLHVGGGVTYLLTREFGLAFHARFSRARVSLSTDGRENIEFDAGGLRAGVGLRVMF